MNVYIKQLECRKNMSDQIDENITTFGLCKSRFSFLKGSLLGSMSVETETEFESNFCIRAAPWAKESESLMVLD
jgi:hypothetical protein